MGTWLGWVGIAAAAAFFALAIYGIEKDKRNLAEREREIAEREAAEEARWALVRSVRASYHDIPYSRRLVPTHRKRGPAND